MKIIGDVKGNKKYYGQALGIANLEQIDPQALIPGNVGNASTYDFPVRLYNVPGLDDNPYPPTRDEKGDYTPDTRKSVDAVKQLEADGVRAIVMACGFFSVVQNELTKAVSIPVLSSPLLLVPLISRLIGNHKKVGIITASKERLTKDFLEPVGITDDINYVITGLEPSEEFYACFMGGTKTTLNVDKLRSEVVSIAKKFIKENPDIGAILLECSDLPPFAADIYKEVEVPVFDYIGFINMLYRAVMPKEYDGIM